MPSPQTSSLLHRHLFVTQPGSEWLAQAETEPEFLTLLSVVNGTPSDWLAWVEDRAVEVTARGIEIEKPVAYRLSLLWNGMIMLQEVKFLADLMETTLRQAFVAFCFNHEVCVDSFSASIPDEKSVFKQFKKLAGDMDFLSNPPTSALLSCFSFYQLTETIARNWKYFPGSEDSVRGFAGLFWHSQPCRDVNSFRTCMKLVRRARNDVAHSKRLFTEADGHHVLGTVSSWLEPLGIEVEARIQAYRTRRPRFLEPLRRLT